MMCIILPVNVQKKWWGCHPVLSPQTTSIKNFPNRNRHTEFEVSRKSNSCIVKILLQSCSRQQTPIVLVPERIKFPHSLCLQSQRETVEEQARGGLTSQVGGEERRILKGTEGISNFFIQKGGGMMTRRDKWKVFPWGRVSTEVTTGTQNCSLTVSTKLPKFGKKNEHKYFSVIKTNQNERNCSSTHCGLSTPANTYRWVTWFFIPHQ